MIGIEQYFGLHLKFPPGPQPDVRANAEQLLERVNALLLQIRIEFPDIEAAEAPKVNSGWRPAAYNATVPGAAVKSKHITGQAIDLADPDGELDNLLLACPELLEEHGLYLEHPAATKNWCHLQTVAPRSGRRVFYP